MNLMLQKLHHYIQNPGHRNTLHAFLFLACSLLSVNDSKAQPKYEFRGVWIATVSNIDWPSDKYLSSIEQRSEFVNLLNMHQQNGMNAVIVQIRPATDAFYPSQYEPWSEWLTGVQGKPPVPYYDPLEFMITETHKRGMEFHAWMNPYRAEFSIDRASISQTHITKLYPEWFLTYGNMKLFDPGNKEVQDYVTNIVRDVVKRYDIDAIHFDDYFYPYPMAGREFPDDATFEKYGNGLRKADWRRSNVDSIIRKLGKAIKQENKYCKFGISPFGVWRSTDKDPEGSNTRGSLSNYDDLYADILLWLKNKWIDYVAPQLYWEFGHRFAGFEKLIGWWANHTYGRHLYIGHGIYRATEENAAWKNRNELPNQIKTLRTHPQAMGSIYYSSKSFNKNPNGWNDSLQNNYYKYPAIIPPMPWIDSVKPQAPKFMNFSARSIKQGIEMSVSFDSANYQYTKQYGIYLSPNGKDSFQLVALIPSKKILRFIIPKEVIPFQYILSQPGTLTHPTVFYLGVTSINKANLESNMLIEYHYGPVQ